MIKNMAKRAWLLLTLLLVSLCSVAHEVRPAYLELREQQPGIPSEHRFNAGLGYSGKTFFGNANLNYAGEALWVDVLNASYAGFTDSYTMLNATLGVKLAGGKVMVSLKGINLTNETIQQHIFGDILKRSIVAELRFFGK